MVASAGNDVSAVLGALFLGFLLGTIMGAGLLYYFLIFRRHGGHHGGSPHYVSAKSENLYVSYPLLDLRHKQLSGSTSSDCGTLRSTTTAGTLRSTKGSNMNGKADYETATIKRSHSQRNSTLLSSPSIRADLDADQLFT